MTGNSGKWILGIGLAIFGFAILFLAFAFFTFTGVVTSAAMEDSYEESTGTGADRVAIVELDEPILTSDAIIRQLRKYQNRSSVKAIVLRLNSPGGAVAPSQEIFQEVKRTVGKGTPVVVSMSSVAASGAYYIACGASKIVANPGTITGSIGVVSQFTDISRLMEKVGVESTTVKSGQYKDTGSPTRPMTRDDVSQIQLLIDDVYAQFVEDVAVSRHMPVDSVYQYADGRVFTGRQAYRYGLVDTLGTLQTAIRLAATLGRIEGEPRVVRERRRESLFERIFGASAQEAIHDIRSNLGTQPMLEYRLSY